MSGLARARALAIGVALLAGTALSSFAVEVLDTSKLPRISGAKVTYAGQPTTIYTTGSSVAQTADDARKMLTANGWKYFVAPNAARAQNPDMEIMTFKKDGVGLNVFISKAPAQGNATGVSYTGIPIASDLPFPTDATDIEFDTNRPILKAVSADAPDKLLAYYRKALGPLGWSLWSAKVGGKQPDGGANGEPTERGAFAYYIRDNQQPIILTLSRRDDGRTKIEIKTIPAQVLTKAREAELNRNKLPVVAAPAPTVAPTAPARTATDDMADTMMKQAMQMAQQAKQGATAAPPPSRPSTDTVVAPTLRARAENSEVPVPLPENAEDVEYKADDGRLEYTSAASVASVAGFYRLNLKAQGWQEQRSPINRPNMVVLNFTKSGKKLMFTLMQMGAETNVTGEGSGLVSAAAKTAEATPSGSNATSSNQPASEEDLSAEESSGLPVPKRRTSTESTRTPFRQELNVNIPLALNDVLGFYRRELTKRNWKETAGADIKADRAQISFTSPSGPAVLKLGRKSNETTVTLATRNPEAAKKAGVLPNPGQVKVMFGNITERDATVTIDKKTIKIGAGVGAKKPDGPTIDLKPGKYKVMLKGGASEEIEVSADEAWGLLVGPGGILPLNVY